MMKTILTLGIAGLLAAVLPGTAQAQMRAAPQAEANQSDDLVQCVRVVVHFTQTGLGFECTSPQGVPTHLFAVTENQFPGRIDLVADLLLNHDLASSDNPRIMNRARLFVRHADPNPGAVRICRDAASLDGAPSCRLAVDVIYRR